MSAGRICSVDAPHLGILSICVPMLQLYGLSLERGDMACAFLEASNQLHLIIFCLISTFLEEKSQTKLILRL